MAMDFAILILLANLLALNCQGEDTVQVPDTDHDNTSGKPSYSFSYGVSDAHTGDIKAVWETKEGDTVKGHYSVLEPDGTMRSVEYTAGPKTGYTAVVNNENNQQIEQSIGRSMAEPKAMRDFEKFYDISEDVDEDDFYDRKNRRPYDPYKEKEYRRKRPKHPFDLEPSEYSHSITIKHPHDESLESEAAHSHVQYNFDPNCKTKTKKESYGNRDNLYSNIVEFDLNRPSKYPIFPPESYSESLDKDAEPSNFKFEKIRPYGNNKYSKYEESIKPSSSMNYGHPVIPDLPNSEYYPEDIPPPRPKKRKRPPKIPEYPSDDLDDYILIPKKKYKPMRVVEPNDYRPEPEEDYDRPSYSSNYDDQEERLHPVRGNTEVIRKIVKKKRPPIVNLLDIFDI